jgi:hypothetical protein
MFTAAILGWSIAGNFLHLFTLVFYIFYIISSKHVGLLQAEQEQ